MRLILILLANKADEKFSCYPSVRTLMAESCAARSTVLNALNRLEHEGLITRVAQYHESGAQRSSRYFLNHPDAPHLKAGPDSGPPGPQEGREGVSSRDREGPGSGPPGGPNPRPLESSRMNRHPNRRQRVCCNPCQSLGDSRPARPRSSRRQSKHALASGWTSQDLKAHLSRRPDGVRYPAAVLARRLAELPTPPSTSLRRRTPWCGECEDEQSRTITVTLPDGTEAAAFCPRCSPQMRPRPVGRNVSDFDSRGGETIVEQRL